MNPCFLQHAVKLEQVSLNLRIDEIWRPKLWVEQAMGRRSGQAEVHQLSVDPPGYRQRIRLSYARQEHNLLFALPYRAAFESGQAP